MSQQFIPTMTPEEEQEWTDIMTGAKETPLFSTARVDHVKCRALREAGKSIHEIAMHFGVSSGTIHYHLGQGISTPQPTG